MRSPFKFGSRKSRKGSSATGLSPKPSAPTRKAPAKPLLSSSVTEMMAAGGEDEAFALTVYGDAREDKAILSVGVVEEANPRYRPTMEDGHCIDYYVGSGQTRK